MARQTIETVRDKLAWLRCAVALSLPQIERSCPEAHARLAEALEETAPITNLAELAVATVEDLRAIERDCTLARPQAMGRAHLTDEQKVDLKYMGQIMDVGE